MLCRELGTELAYTPMLHARLFNEMPMFREQHWDPHPSDRPLIAQFAGHDPATVLAAARRVEKHVDAVDLNFGCPQGIARKGRYGAFLLDEPDIMVELTSTLASKLNVPVTVKLRLLPSREASVALCKRLEAAGASALCLHGRTRDQNKQYVGAASWDAIRDVVRTLDIPVIANGGIATRKDCEACLEYTGAAAVMSSEALLENPALFCGNVHPVTGDYVDQSWLARRYLDICADHPPAKGAAIVRGHLFKILHNGLSQHPSLRDELLLARTLSEITAVVDKLDAAGWDMPNFHAARAAETAGATAEAEASAAAIVAAEAESSSEHRIERPDVSWYRRHRVNSTSALASAAESAAEKNVHESVHTLARGDARGGGAPMSREEAEAAALAKRRNKRRAKQQRFKRKKEARAGKTRQERGEGRGVRSQPWVDG